MTTFSTYCNEMLGTRGNWGIIEIDRMIIREIKRDVRCENIVGMENIREMVEDQLSIEDDTMRKIAQARIMFVIARMLASMNARDREHVKRYIDEEIPSYMEAERWYNRLNQ